VTVPRPIILGVVGDSAAGKTTITRGLLRSLGEQHVTHIATDDYHRYDRKQRAARGITPLHPECNYLDIMEQDLQHVLAGRSILKPVYQHQDGTFGAPVYVTPRRFTVVEGLLAYHTGPLRDCFDVRVYLAPPEELRRQWKVRRDCTRRGYTTDQVLDELDRREADSVSFIRPQQRFADIVVSFSLPEGDENKEHLDAALTLRDTLEHPDLSPLIAGNEQGMRIVEAAGETRLWIPGAIEGGVATEVEEAIWDRMHFASHLRSERLGEFTIGTDLHRSHSLAIVQVLVLYHLVTARAAVALGGEGSRADRDVLPLEQPETLEAR
jgi:phosphoribulokinase